jgi:hypothetical protein
MNPYQPPMDNAGPRPGTLLPDERARLRDIARFQRNINLVILAYFGAGVVTQILNQVLIGRIIVGLVVLGVIIAGAVFAVQMARALYSTGVAVLCGILLLIPCVGLLTLLVLNNRATARLKAAGIPVGILGADPGDVARVLGAP